MSKAKFRTLHGFKLQPINSNCFVICGTGLSLVRGENPRYGHPQEWHVVVQPQIDRPLVSGVSQADAMERMAKLRDAMDALRANEAAV